LLIIAAKYHATTIPPAAQHESISRSRLDLQAPYADSILFLFQFQHHLRKSPQRIQKKTRQHLTAHPLATQLDKCDSPAAILAILQDQVDQFDQSQSRDERLQRWLSPTINVLVAFTEMLGEGISLVNIN
jgi:hypothetical protein